MRVATEREGVLLVSMRERIRLLGGAPKTWDRCLAAGWIRPAGSAGPIQYYRYGDIAALAKRLRRERPPRLRTLGREEVDQADEVA